VNEKKYALNDKKNIIVRVKRCSGNYLC